VPFAAPGAWYVLVYGTAVPGPSSYSLRAVTAPLFVNAVTPDQYAGSQTATLTVKGAVEDLEALKDRLLDNRSLRRYLEAKYFPHLVVPVENAIFRSLWRLVFKVEDARCEANRPINYRTLRVLYERRPQDINRLIEDDKAYFGQVSVAGTPLDYLLTFLGKCPAIFPLLSPATRILIETYANETLDRFSTAWFLSENVERHIEEFARRVSEDRVWLHKKRFGAVSQAAREHGCLPRIIDVGIGLYGRSGNFNIADERFDATIRPLLADYCADQIRRLLQAIEGNPQTYDRRRAKADHAEVQEAVHRLLGPDTDLTEYRNFQESLS
jgi:hypothetical protein